MKPDMIVTPTLAPSPPTIELRTMPATEYFMSRPMRTLSAILAGVSTAAPSRVQSGHIFLFPPGWVFKGVVETIVVWAVFALGARTMA